MQLQRGGSARAVEPGGWENYQHGIETDDSIVGAPVIAKIEADRWYDVMIEVEGRRLRCYLDGALISDAMLPLPGTVLAIGGRDEKSGDVILKIVDTTGGVVDAAVRPDDATYVSPEGELTVLTSRSTEDENSFEEPAKIAPVSRPIKTADRSELPVAPYSLNVLRLHAKDNPQ